MNHFIMLYIQGDSSLQQVMDAIKPIGPWKGAALTKTKGKISLQEVKDLSVQFFKGLKNHPISVMEMFYKKDHK